MATIHKFPQDEEFSDDIFNRMLEQFKFVDEQSKAEFKMRTLPLLIECRRISKEIHFEDFPDLGIPNQARVQKWVCGKLDAYVRKITVEIYFRIMAWAYLVALEKAEFKKNLNPK